MKEMLEFGLTYTFEYRNHKGEVAMRRIIFDGMRVGTHEPYYLEPTLLLCGWDLDKGANREFDASKIVGKTFRRLP